MKSINYKFVITLVSITTLIFGSYQIASGYCYEKDFKALKTFYESTNGDSWLNNAGWELVKNNDSPPANCDLANLKGVTVWAGRVIRLQLSQNNLSGQIPGSLYFLDKLQILDLSANSLSGRIPVKIGYCLNLINVNLKDNNLESRIPSSISFLKKLSHLTLSNNNLNGGIPKQISNCANLVRVELSGNQLNRDIPTQIGQLQKMITFDVSKNQLSGSIPEELGQCKNLRYCFLNDNKLTGSIPEEIADLEKLRKFYVRNNQMEGCYPNNLRKICETLDAYSNTDYAISEGNNFYATWEKFDKYFSGACETKLFSKNNDLINIFPNPTKGLINVSISQNDLNFDAATTQIEIFNTVGRKVYSNTIDSQIMKDINLNLSYLTSGNYLLIVKNDSKIHSKKLLIN